MDKITKRDIRLTFIKRNEGQIEGVPSNPRIIRDAKFKKLVKSIEDDPDMLQLREIIVYDNATDPKKPEYVVIGGNMRLEALKALKYKEAPCKIIPHDADKQFLKSVILKDNSEFGEWDFDALCNDWDKDLLEAADIEIPDVAADTDEDEAQDDNFDVAANTPKVAKSKPGDVYKLGPHRLICGDSTKPETLENLLGQEVADLLVTDLLVTDPPYNVAVGVSDIKEAKLRHRRTDGKVIENDKMADDKFEEFCNEFAKNAIEHLKPGAPFYWFIASKTQTVLELAINNAGQEVRQVLIWNKNSLVLGRQDYQWKHEPCLYGWKDGAAHYFTPRRDITTIMDEIGNADLEKMSKAEMKDLLQRISELPTTVIDCNKPSKSEDHPTMKPVPLIGQLVKNSSRIGDIVLDIFGGSGTTLIACEQLQRKCRMVEYEPMYVDVIIKRWEELTGGKAQLLYNVNDQKAAEDISAE